MSEKKPCKCEVPDYQGRHTYDEKPYSTHVYWCRNCDWGKTVKKHRQTGQTYNQKCEG